MHSWTTEPNFFNKFFEMMYFRIKQTLYLSLIYFTPYQMTSNLILVGIYAYHTHSPFISHFYPIRRNNPLHFPPYRLRIQICHIIQPVQLLRKLFHIKRNRLPDMN